MFTVSAVLERACGLTQMIAFLDHQLTRNNGVRLLFAHDVKTSLKSRMFDRCVRQGTTRWLGECIQLASLLLLPMWITTLLPSSVNEFPDERQLAQRLRLVVFAMRIAV